MPAHTRTQRAALASAISISLALSGCGGGSDDESGTPPLTAQSAQVTVQTSGTPANGFATGTTADVTVDAARTSALAGAVLKLNGTDVSSTFHTANDGKLTGTLSNLQPGPNVLTVSAAGGTTQLARRTITSAVPMVATCSSLQGLAIPAAAIGTPSGNATIVTATSVAAAPATQVTNTDGSTATVNPTITQLANPDYCRLLGTIAPLDPAAPLINFQIDLPLQWNQKLAQMGGSGFNGVIPGSLTGVGMRFGPESIPPDAPYAITRGYVVFGSDSGHQGGATAWALNKEAFANYGYLQVKKTHDVAAYVSTLA